MNNMIAANSVKRNVNQGRTTAILTIKGIRFGAETERKELTIQNPFVNTRNIQGMLYSMYYITGKLYAIQIGINPRTPFSVKDGQRDEDSKQPGVGRYQ